MRTRELIYALKKLEAEPVRCGWFPDRADVRKAAAAEYDRLARLGDLLPEIIEKLTATDRSGK